jgi:hypothetical protein
VTAGWVAATVRAKGMARRVLGTDPARGLAACSSLPQAQRMLASSSYRRAGEPGLTLMGAQHTVAATLLWDLRVLAGWLPRDGVGVLRVLAGWFEIANIDELLQPQTGLQPGDEFQLGALATAWPRLRLAGSPSGLRAALAASPWHDPGGDSALDIRLGVRARWAARAAACGDPLRTWAVGAAVLLLAGERFAAGRAVQPAVLDCARTLLGQTAAGAASLDRLRSGLPGSARWVLSGVRSPEDLWQAESTWWRRVERDGHALLRASGPDSGPVLGAVAVMAADARRICAALELAARGGAPLEEYDAVA